MTVHQEPIEMVRLFIDVAMTDPLSALLMAIGGLLVGVSSGVFGYLALRAGLDLFTTQHGEGPPRQAR